MKIAVITGASSGMGKEFVYAIDREYELDELWVIARRLDRLEELQEKCRTKIRPISLDLSTEDSFDQYKNLLDKELPDIQVLVNAAGYGIFGSFDETILKEQLGMIDVNTKALTAFCRLSLTMMKEGSTIINIGSNSSWQPVPYMSVYAAGKAYVLSFSRALGRELKNRGIHVMCVCPGWVKTEFIDIAAKDDTVSYYDRWYTPEQVVERAMDDLKKKRKVSIMGLPVRMQVRLVKFLPVDLIMNIWCKQQGK